MTHRPLSILLVEDEAPIAATLAELLGARDHRVTVVGSGEEALAHGACDVLVADVGLDGISGLDLLEELRLRGESPRVVIVSGQHDVQHVQRALRLGAADFLTKPFPPEDLVAAVEGAQRPAARAADEAIWSRTYRATEAAVEQAVRDLAAHALRHGVGPAARARLATACAEVLDNAARFAYPHQPGPVHVTAHVDGRQMEVTVRDEGLGFDVVEVGLDRMDDSQDGGLARASALSEDLRIETTVGVGTTARLRFTVYRVLFDEDGPFDLSEEDWLSPELAKRVLEDLADEELCESPVQLSPAMAVTIGRLLAGPDPRRVLHTALWS